MRRILFLLLIAAALAPGTWLREPAPPENDAQELHFARLRLPSRAVRDAYLGRFELEAAWALSSRNTRFGGYSALLPLGGGELLAIGDRGYLMRFSAPDARQHPVHIGRIRGWALDERYGSDAESATIDPAGGAIWIGWESSNSISRHPPGPGEPAVIRPKAMRGWGRNTGPEALVRLADGRFIVLREGFTGWLEDRDHPALLFAGDPLRAKAPQAFLFAGPPGFSVTDMAQLPDGRVLILMRRLLWPAPARFAGRIVLADPAEIRAGKTWRGRVVARLSPPLPVDNFEGLAIEPRAGGKVTVWLISDANSAVSQRTLLWKLAIDPSRL